MEGRLIRFFLPFRENDRTINSNEQAEKILQTAIDYLKAGYKKVGITYSANYDQTRQIRHTYEEGKWRTGTSGANQAQVMSELEDLLMGKYTLLQRKFEILPITTMTYSSYEGQTHEEVVEEDLKHLEEFIKNGGLVLGWTNQLTHPKFAVGGGIAQLPVELSEKIQSRLGDLTET